MVEVFLPENRSKTKMPACIPLTVLGHPSQCSKAQKGKIKEFKGRKSTVIMHTDDIIL